MSTTLDTVDIRIDQVPTAPATLRARPRRLIEAAAFTAVWIGLGLALHLDGRVYIALGIPLTVAFQLFVRRRPVRDLWVRDGDPFRLDRRDRLVAGLLVAYPLIAGTIFAAQGQGLNAMMAFCAAPGALAAAYAFRRFGHAYGPALRWAGVATVIGVGWMLVMVLPALKPTADVSDMLLRGLHSLLLYLPICFVLEEVSFRGLVDAHVHAPGERFGWLSAVFASSLWALWHLPIDIGTQPTAELILWLLVIHVSIGVPLSFAWRRAGNLTLPAAAHTVIDSIRDGLLAGT